jgi:LmbE family N-acetylglucosaminyl deacetylase
LIFLVLGLNGPLPAQLRVQPAGELPAEASLRLMLRKLSTVGTFMETTAHPDDEDNALLAMMSHGEGMRAVLVTATRGDGGQNEIGPEIFQALGVLRTEELLAVHRFDGAEQYFTRAIDFGYSFSLEESIEKWGREEIVGDFVRHIRATRPDVIAGFICGGEGGGQHHQASTRLTAEAFRAAADASRYPEQIRAGLRPWQAQRLFCLQGFSFQSQPAAAVSPGLLRVSPGGFDPLLGRTYNELGLEARSMHKCQGTSQLLLLPGQSPTRTYQLMDTVVGEPGIAPPRLFDGIDTTLNGLGVYAGASPPSALTASLRAIGASVAAASRAVANGPAAAAPALAAGLAGVRDLRAKLAALGLSDTARYEIEFRLAQKEEQFQAALVLTHGIRVEALADDGTVVAGQPVTLSIVAGNNGRGDVSVKKVTIAGFEGPPAACAGSIRSGGAMTCTAEMRVGAVPLSTPYWTPRSDAARYDFEPDAPFGLPFRPSPFRASLLLSIGGADVTIERTIEYRYSDLFAGEKRMELQVVPPFAVRVSPDIAVIPGGAVTTAASTGAGSRTRNVAVTVANNQKAAMAAALSLSVPAGWQSTPVSTTIAFERQDEEVTVTFAVTPGRSVEPGDYSVEATAATIAGPAATSNAGYEVVEYPHIHRRHVIQPARARVKVIDVAIAPGLRVGYIMGVGDQMPTAIEQLGAEVRLIGAAELASGDLSRYDVIVTGVRAYERRPDLRANNHRLLSYVENGGTVLVNYNKQEFNQAPYGPYPVKVGTDRVTDENAPVEILAPAHPVFNAPNRIGPETWAGWVQERGTYFLGERDPRYADLIRTTDPFPLNAGPKTGALVEARSGTGRWIYIGLGLWRQLPAGTDGAYRLLANLLSLGRR